MSPSNGAITRPSRQVRSATVAFSSSGSPWNTRW